MRKTIRTLLVLMLFLGMLLGTPLNKSYASNDIKVLLEHKELSFDVPPQIIEGRTLLPLRAIFEALGLEVGWDDATRIITGMTEDKEIILKLDSKDAKVNGVNKSLDVPAKAINGRTLVPVRFIAESLDMNVVWNQESKTVKISKDDIIEWKYEGYEGVEPFKEYERKYVNGLKSVETRYNGKNHNVKVEWRNAGYELSAPYKEYEIKYINDEETTEIRYTGKTKPAEITYKKINYKWEYPHGWLSWEYSLNIPVEAVNLYKSIDRNEIFGYSYYVTHEADDDYLLLLSNVFRNTAKKEKLSEWDAINLAVSFVQSLKYIPDDIGTGYDEYPKFPLETLFDEGGDCEDSSILLASLLRELGYGTVLVIVDNHMGVGIKASEPANFKYLGMDFYYIETTSPGWMVGELPKELEGKKITILPVNY